jgi:periplasmic protein TonB
MSAEQTLPTLDPAHALRPSLLAPGRQRQPVFWLALLAAALAHGALVIGISHAPPRHLGDPNGSDEAIDVELVDEDELRSMGSRQTPANAPPAPPAAQAANPAAATPPPEQPPAETAPETKPEATPPTDTAPQAVPEAKTEPAPPQKSAALPAFETDVTQDTPPPEAVPKESKESVKSENPTKSEIPPKKESAAKPTPKTAVKPPAKLDLSVPFDMSMQSAAGGASASAATRPPGITRSGANDRFGLDVIRALKKTMPPSEGVTGKVKVRIFLNERGNVAWVRVVDGSGDRLLDDSVLFSVRQSIFPFPPKGASEADRTFLVTYVYR